MDITLTCGLCGTKLNEKYCSYCKIELEEKYISEDNKRMSHYKEFRHLPDRSLVFCDTSELIEMETIDLLCLLRFARKHRAEAFKLRKLRHDAEKAEGLTQSVKDIDKYSYKEYDDSTRKVWVIENIIKSRIGYYPLKITDNFLNMFLDRMKKTEERDMIIKG